MDITVILSTLAILLQYSQAQQCEQIPPRWEIGMTDVHLKMRNHANPSRRRQEPSPPAELIQLTNPPPPNERNWVMVAGNETQVDSVLSASLSMGGRLVSIGFFSLHNMMNYFAIMHRYSGAVFIKPGPMTIDQLIKAIRQGKTIGENEIRDLALTQVCGQEGPGGQITFGTYWEQSSDLRQEIWFPNTKHAESQREHYEANGLRLHHLCGFVQAGKPRYIGVWRNTPSSTLPYEAHYGLSLKRCLQKNDELVKRSYVATKFSVFQLGTELLCTGIWEYAPGHRHFIRVGMDIRVAMRSFIPPSIVLIQSMHAEFVAMPAVQPRQMSHYLSSPTKVQFVVLWSDYASGRLPPKPALWSNGTRIPVSFVDGTQLLLRPNQLNFAIQRIESFMRMYDLPALSIAIAKHERLKFAAAFGFTDIRKREQATPSSLFRIGSVSKPITAAAVMLLVDRGLISLEAPLFGEGRIFGMDYATLGRYGEYVEQVTLRHLLEHTTGGWDNEEGDLAWSMPKSDTHSLIKMVLSLPLPDPPGRKWIYSNFGYVLLGKVIEKITHMSYEDFVYAALLSPSGARDSFIARGTIGERRARESLYYMSGSSIGFDPYEMLSPERIGPWGGWVSTPVQMLKFLSSVDGSPIRPDIITARSVIEWATPSIASNRSYGLGWSINVMGFNGWQHDGRMPGASSMLVRLASGHSMAISTNKEFIAREFFHDMAYLLHHLVHQCDWWNDHNDLFPYIN